jgi:hypothetical protein
VSRTVTPRSVRKFTPRGDRSITRRTVREHTPRATRNVTPRLTPRAGRNMANAGKFRSTHIRGAGRTTIGGHRYSVWRGKHRFRHGGNWRTFAALSALGSIAIGSSDYYPYAYISAPEAYCDGFTEDGCQLSWRDVETVEGDTVEQCVAYCPWQ